MAFDFAKCGGKPILPEGARMLGDVAPEDVAWNFGVKEEVAALIRHRDVPSLHEKYPRMAGAWDGNSTINHADIVAKNHSGDFSKVEELVQQQPRGTCGGRSGSLVLDFVQHILIGSGKRAKFKRTSHAAVYYLARKLYGWIGSGNWRNDNDDGVAGGSVPDALKKYGITHRPETNDLNGYGEGSDDLACQLVCGVHPQLEQLILKEAADNLVTEWVAIRSAQEGADAIASGGVIVGSDNRGFSMTRDSNGFCRPQGAWSHYHARTGVGKWGGQKGFIYWQSWGKNTPSGTKVPGCPGNCFLVDWNTQDGLFRNGQYAAIFGFPLWELETTPVVPWVF